MLTHMQAITLSDWGDAQQFQLNTIPVPKLEADDVLVKVAYAGLNPADWKMRAGFLSAAFTQLQAPYVLGLDASGTIAALGDKVSDFEIGDRVVTGNNLFQAGKPGAYAQYLVVSTKRITKLPDNVPLEQAASLPTAGITAWQALFAADKGNLPLGNLNKKVNEAAPKKKVLINGASGGVGSFAVQLAKWAGLDVATTSGTQNVDYVTSLGADYAIDYRRQDIQQALKKWAPEGVDLIIDAVSAGSLTNPLMMLKPGGKLVSIATITHDGDVEAQMASAKAANKHFVLAIVSDANMANELNQLVTLVQQKLVRFPATKTYAMNDMTQAHLELEAGHVRGKLIIKID